MRDTPLIIGCHSVIGSALFELFKARATQVVGTTRRKGTQHQLLDLDTELGRWKIPDFVSIAYVCIAITSTKICERERERTWYINVERTQRLIDRLLKQDIHVVFLSSDLVNDSGAEYGSQKKEVEEYLHGRRATVVRLGKVINKETGRLAKWVNELEAGQTIEPFNDYYFAPVSMKHVLGVLGDPELLKTSTNILVSANSQLTYFDAIDLIADIRGLDRSLIFPKPSCRPNMDVFDTPSGEKEFRYCVQQTLTDVFGCNAEYL